jgi:hypothetical protein
MTLHNPCAVADCEHEGRPFTCPYDGSRHGHGRIHYETGKTGLVFRGGWHLICYVHYQACCAEWAARTGYRVEPHV